MIFNKKDNKNAIIQENDEPSIAEWLDDDRGTEGQLAIDVFQTDKKIVIKSTIAGVRPEDLKISLHHDLLTIKGSRAVKEDVRDEDYLFRECYWGSFSRSIILPAEVDSRRVEAELESGVLTINLYKNNPSQIEVIAKD